MSKKIKWISFSFMAILVLLYAQLFFFDPQPGFDPQGLSPDLHIKVIMDSSDSYFYAQFKLGASTASEDHNVYVEFEELAKWEDNALRESVVIALKSGVDAVAFQSNDPAFVVEMHELAAECGVKILLFESENYHNDLVTAVGSNPYSVGREAAILAMEATGGECQAMLVVDKTSGDVLSTYQSMKLQGILEIFSEYPSAEIVETLTIGDGVMEGEALAKTLVSLQNSYNSIICLHEKTTPLIAQRLIDSNLLSSVQLIGYGMLPQTLDYVNRGVVYGTIAPDAYRIGYNTVEYIVSMFSDVQVNDYPVTKLYTITEDNVEQYLGYWKEEDM